MFHIVLLIVYLALMQVSLMDENGNTKDDLSLPKGTDDAEKLAQQIKEDFDAGKELVVTVLKVRMFSPECICMLHLYETFPALLPEGTSP